MNTLNIELDKNTKKYLSLYRLIKDLIITGKLSPGERIPSKRELSLSLKVSKNTIMLAYDLLVNEGYIKAKDRSGYYVEDNRYYNKSKIEETKTKEATIKYDFTSENVDEETFPYFTLRKIANELMLDEAKAIWLKKSPYQGDEDLRTTIAHYLYENKGMEVSANNIVIISSLEESLNIIDNLINVKSLGIEDPSYIKVYERFKNRNIKLFTIDDEGIVLDDNKPLSLIYVTPYNQFPTGKKMSVERKRALLKYPVDYIFEDDFDCDLLLQGKIMSTLYSLNNAKVIYHGSFSHSICPGLRISYLVLPNTLLKKYQSLYQNTSSTISSFDQKLINTFILEGYYYRHLTRLKKTLKIKKDLVEQYLISHHYTYIKTELSFLVDVDENRIKKNIEKYHLKANFIEKYLVKNTYHNYLIINYFSIKESEIVTGLDLLLE